MHAVFSPTDNCRTARAPLGHITWLAILATLAGGSAWLVRSVEQDWAIRHINDIKRRWVVFQYVQAGVNPYPIALAALENRYGPVEGIRLAKTKVFNVPRYSPAELQKQHPQLASPEACALLSAHGPPESVYPPSSDFLMAPVLDWLPLPWLTPIWLASNVLLIGLCGLLIASEVARAGGRRVMLVWAGLFLCWAPTQMCVELGQYTLLVLAALLFGFRLLQGRPILAGLCFSLALIKPSVSLPFLILPLVRRRWLTLAVVACVHVIGTLVPAAVYGVAPWTLLTQWLRAAAYFTHGMYTLQEYLNLAGLDNGPAAKGLLFVFLASVLAVCWHSRAAAAEMIVDLLCVTSVLWTYHNPYDFVILFVPIARLASRAFAEERTHVFPLIVAGMSFLVFGAGLSEVVYKGDDPLSPLRLVRWGVRLGLAAWLSGMAVAAWRQAKRNQASEPQVLAVTVRITDPMFRDTRASRLSEGSDAPAVKQPGGAVLPQP